MSVALALLCDVRAVRAEGAFGTVDKRRYTDEHGKSAFYAVKRLKKQDVSLEVRLLPPLLFNTWSRSLGAVNVQ